MVGRVSFELTTIRLKGDWSLLILQETVQLFLFSSPPRPPGFAEGV